MNERLYADLAPWWPLISPTVEYADNAATVLELFAGTAQGPVRSVLELGSGGGHLSSNFPADIDLVLLDVSPAMLEVSRALQPARVHACDDMRTARLGRSFDAVLLHDAVHYLASRDDLASAFATAFAHLRPGGAFLVLPDLVAESFSEGLDAGGGDDGSRSARLFEWTWDPDPFDEAYRIDMALLLREGDDVRCVHDTHTMALYSRDVYWEALRAGGFEPVESDPLLAVRLPEVFAGRRP